MKKKTALCLVSLFALLLCWASVVTAEGKAIDRNPNTGHPFGVDAELRKATQTVYHNAQHASHILLPVIPKQPKEISVF